MGFSLDDYLKKKQGQGSGQPAQDREETGGGGGFSLDKYIMGRMPSTEERKVGSTTSAPQPQVGTKDNTPVQTPITSEAIKTAHEAAQQEVDQIKNRGDIKNWTADEMARSMELLSMGGSPEEMATRQQELVDNGVRRRKQEIGAAESKRDGLAAAYYDVENQEKKAAMSQDKTASNLYASLQALQKDRKQYQALMGTGSLAREAMQGELSRKYGVGVGGDLLSTMLQKEAEAKAALAELGYDFDRMEEYQRTQEQKAKAEEKQRKTAEFASGGIRITEGALRDMQGFMADPEGYRPVIDDTYLKENEEATKVASGVVSSAASVLASPLQGIDYLQKLGQGVGRSDQNDLDHYVPLHTYDMDATNFVRTVRGTVAQEIEDEVEGTWGKVGSFAYQTGMSMADFLFNSFLTGNFTGGLGGAGTEAAKKAASNLSLAIMGAGAASNTTMEAIERGLNNRQALTLGAMAGIAEVITENVSLEALLDKTSMGKSLRGYILQNVISEGSEEVGSDIINLVADILISKDKSEWAQSVAAYEAQGPTPGQAMGMAVKDQALNMGLDFLGGALSGGILAGGNAALNLAMNGHETAEAAKEAQNGPQEAEGARQGVGPGIFTPTAEGQQVGLETSKRGKTDDPLLTALFGRQTQAENITPHGVETQEILDGTTVLGYTGNKETVSAASVMERLARGEEVPLEEIYRVPEIAEVKDRHQNPTAGIMTKERAELRQSVLNQLLGTGSYVHGDGYTGAVRQDRRADIVIGVPAAGKSSVLVNPLSQQHGSRVIDSDMAKELLPEYDSGKGAADVHRESSMIRDSLLEEATVRGDNLVWPQVGSDLQKLIADIQGLKAAGYQVYLHLNELPAGKAAGRAINRFLTEGRYVDPGIVMRAGDAPTRNYETIRGMGGLLDGYSRYSNDVPRGADPRFVESSESGSRIAAPGAGDASGLVDLGGLRGGRENGLGGPAESGEAHQSGEGAAGQRGTQLGGTAGEGVSGLQESDTGGAGERSFGQGDLRAPGKLELTEVTDRSAYSKLLDEARASDPEHGWAVTPKTAEELAQTRTFLSEDGGVGFAIAPDGDIEAVFRNKARHPQGRAMRAAIPQAISEGGTKLDCYGRGLVNIYSDSGFAPVARVKFNPEYANPGWADGMEQPDIYVMMATDTDPDVVRQKQGSYKAWTQEELDALPVMAYDDAMAYRDRLLAERGLFTQDGGKTGDAAADHLQGDVENSIGAAARGFTTPGTDVNREATSRLADGVLHSTPSRREAAAVKTRKEWNDLLRYKVQSEEQSMQYAAEQLYYDVGGKRAFLMDFSPESYQALTDELRSAPAWNGVMSDMAVMIAQELERRSLWYNPGIDVDTPVSEDVYRDWVQTMREHATETGRGTQAWAKWTRNDILGGMRDFLESDQARHLTEEQKSEIRDHVTNQLAAYQSLADGDVDGLIDLIKQNSKIRRTTGLFSQETSGPMSWALERVAKMEGGEAYLRQVAQSQIRSIATDYRALSPIEAVKSFRFLNMLSKATTVNRNLVGNNVFDPVESLANNVAVPLDMLLSKLTGRRTTTLDASWLSKAKRRGSYDGLLKSIVAVGLDVDPDASTGRYEGTGSSRTFKMTGNPVERLFSTWAKFENYLLKSTDEMQKGGIEAETQRGIDRLKERGLLGEDELVNWAAETAKQRTFQNDGATRRAVTGLRDAANNFAVTDSRGGRLGVGDLFIPFAGVPANLAAQSANYSPAGLVLHGGQTIVDAIAQGKNMTAEKQAQLVRNVGRGITGTALVAFFTAVAAKGLMKVAGSDDPDKEALEKAQGLNGTQWNISATQRWLNGGSTKWQDGDTLVQIGFLDPINANMTMGSMIAEAYEDGVLSPKEIADANASGIVEAVLDLPAMSTIGDIVDGWRYSDGETSGEKATDALGGALFSQASSLTPNFLRGVAQGMDNTVRNQYTSETPLGEAVDSIKAGIPGLRETLPASLDGFGRERSYASDPLLNALNANLLPGQVTQYSVDPLEAEIERLYGKTGEVSVYPDRKAPNSITVDKERVNLDAEEKDAYQRTYGETAYDMLTELMTKPAYQNSSAEDKEDLMTLMYRYATAEAKANVSDYEPDGKIAKAKAAEKVGMDPVDYFLMDWSMDVDGNGSITQAEAQAALDKQRDLTRAQKAELWTIINKSWKTNPYKD